MIWHLFKKDLRHARFLVLAWLGLEGLKAAVAASRAPAGDRVMEALVLTLSVLVPLLQTILLILLIPDLIHQEPLVGTSAFWFTRPLRRSSVLGAKTLFAALLIGLSLASAVTLLLANGVTHHDVALAVPEILLSQLELIVILGLVACLTATFGRFAIAGASLLVAMFLLSAGLLWLTYLRTGGTMLGGDAFSLLRSRSVVQSVVITVAGAAIIVHQYLTRRTRRSVVAGCALVVAALVIQGFWPWDIFAQPPLPNFAAQADVNAVTVQLTGTSLTEVSQLRGLGEPLKELEGTLEFTGLPPGIVTHARRVQARLTLRDGTVVPTHAPASGLEFHAQLSQPELDAIEVALGGIPIVNPGYSGSRTTGLLQMEADRFNQYAGQSLHLAADLELVASRYVIDAECPLVRGARFDRGSEHAVVTDVLRQADGVVVVVRDRQARLLFDRQSTVNPGLISVEPPSLTQETYLLCNRSRHQAIRPRSDYGVDPGQVVTVGIDTLVQRTLRLGFGPERFVLTPDLDSNWLAGAELIRVHSVPVGVFGKTLVVENFSLTGHNGTAVPAAAEASPPSFAHLTLPEHPTMDQARAYVHAIILASQSRPYAFRPDDPQVGLLLKVGHENLNVLLQEDSTIHDKILAQAPQAYLAVAIARLVKPQDKDLILEMLPRDHNLVSLVTQYGWIAEAHDALVAALQDPQVTGLPRAWIQAVASFKDPATYPALKAYLIRCTNRQETFNAIRKLPGIDLAATVDAAWRQAQRGPSPYQVLDGCALAAEFGHADAIDALASILREPDDAGLSTRAAVLFKRYTPATGDAAALLAWYDAHRDHLMFEVRQKKFVPPTSP